jgi:hypothetical protein
MLDIGQGRLRVRWIAWHRAKDFVRLHHRHHAQPRGFIVCLGVWDMAGELRGVAILARPVSRMLDSGDVVEVTRVATDGCPNACSALYGASRRVAQVLGFDRAVTYTLPSEGGASLRGAGFRCDGSAGGGSWSRAARQRQDHASLDVKVRWTTADPPMTPQRPTGESSR